MAGDSDAMLNDADAPPPRQPVGKAPEAQESARPRVLLVGSNWSHMGSHSGLTPLGDALAKHVDLERVVPGKLDKLKVLATRAAAVLGEKVLGQRRIPFWSPFHDLQKMIIETAAMRMARQGNYDCVLFESVEDLFRGFGSVRSSIPQTMVMGIVHQPPAWWRLFVAQGSLLDPFDELITLSQRARVYLEQDLGHKNVSFMHHGVDDAFFFPGGKPLDTSEDEFNVVFCGQWLRDFAALEAIVAEVDRRLGQLPRKVVFHLVIPMGKRTVEAHYRLAASDSVRWYANLSDEALRRLYRNSHLLFLPMIDATANNAVLESMACGLPMLLNPVGGIPDYVDESMAVFMTGNDGERPLDRLVWCMENYGACVERAARARVRVEQTLAWSHVAASLAGKIDDLLRDQKERKGIKND